MTHISFMLPVDSKVRIAVYNLLGEEVVELANSEFVFGSHTFSFDADGFTSGIYFYKVSAQNFIAIRKMIILG
ncbi:MAG: T9SS type A sorting domain-containing protein [Bacteroidetes bacterium]|nr:T9SS type A sorting domain-containing protein [Bacteroidota bacterium]MCH8034813.1 T9SS type A sorting domain-containing protein [Bacteroidota bacterium]